MSKSIEEKLFDSIKDETQQRRLELRRLFYAYTDPLHEFWGLVHVLASVQKAYGPCDWIAKVNDVMQAMEVHDAGLFPDEWFSELDGGAA